MSALKSVSYVLNRFLLRRAFLNARVGELKFRVKTEDVVGRHIYKYGRHEPQLTEWLRATVEPRDGELLIDIGANIGWYALLFETLCRGTTAEVHAFEPAPDNLDLIRHNLQQNQAQHVTLHEMGLSDNSEGAALHLFSDANRGRHSLLPINDHATVDIPTARLDDVLESMQLADRPVRLMKIDIEGFELIALRGAHATLECCEVVVTEFSPHYMRQGGLKPRDMLDLLASKGFEPGLLKDGEVVMTSVDSLEAADRQCDIIWQRR
ncbi:MAG: FkbM family methyltransferase [Pseudomonadota bacterium]